MKIQRKEYLDKLAAFRDKQVIKVISGVRRCGKSTLMELYQDHLRTCGVKDEQIVAVNLEDYDHYQLRNPRNLHQSIKERLVKDKMTYVFIDEIQRCEDFPEVLDSLQIKPNVDIYVTGSNAYMLSSDIATLISGRFVEIKMLPLSFREYVEGTGNSDNLPGAYKAYVENSSFPYALAFQNQPRELRDYLEGIYNTIVVKDIALRHKIPDTMILESVARFVFDNIGNQLSAKKVADTMTSYGRKIDAKTVEKYLTALMDSFIVYEAKRYDVKGKQHLKTLEKYYVVDVGLRRMLLGSRSMDVGHILENVVYLELLRRGCDVYVGKVGGLEVDFVAMDSDGIIYYQVAATVREENALRRELASLQKIADHYPKYILTLDDDPDGDYGGIRRINVLNWLMGQIGK